MKDKESFLTEERSTSWINAASWDGGVRFIFIHFHCSLLHATRILKATFRKKLKEMWDLFLSTSLFCLVNENSKVRFAIMHFLWIMKCNLREQMPKQVSFWNKSQFFLRRISRPKLSSHNPWSTRLETYKVFFKFFSASYVVFLCATILFRLKCVLWLKGV